MHRSFIESIFIIIKHRKQPKCSSIEEWLNKLGFIHTVECTAVKKRMKNIKRTALQINELIWSDLQDIPLSEKSQVQKSSYNMPLFI